MLVPELLDSLAPHEPAARQSRRDLRVLNRLMGNDRWLEFAVTRLARPGESRLEIGAGEGHLARRLPRCDAADFCPPPAGWPVESRWYCGDVREFASWHDYPVIFGNLVFHHFNADELTALGTKIRRHARVFIANEPARGRGWQLIFSGLCPLIGAHPVTRHDGRASIRAGFAGDELPRVLGFTGPDWHFAVRRTWCGAYRCIALRA